MLVIYFLNNHETMIMASSSVRDIMDNQYLISIDYYL